MKSILQRPTMINGAVVLISNLFYQCTYVRVQYFNTHVKPFCTRFLLTEQSLTAVYKALPTFYADPSTGERRPRKESKFGRYPQRYAKFFLIYQGRRERRRIVFGALKWTLSLGSPCREGVRKGEGGPSLSPISLPSSFATVSLSRVPILKLFLSLP